MHQFNFFSPFVHQTKHIQRWYITSSLLICILITILFGINYYQWKQLHRLRLQSQEYEHMRNTLTNYKHRTTNTKKQPIRILNAILNNIELSIPDNVYLESFIYNQQSLQLTGYALCQQSATHFVYKLSQYQYVRNPSCTIDYHENHEPVYQFTFIACLLPTTTLIP